MDLVTTRVYFLIESNIFRFHKQCLGCILLPADMDNSALPFCALNLDPHFGPISPVPCPEIANCPHHNIRCSLHFEWLDDVSNVNVFIVVVSLFSRFYETYLANCAIMHGFFNRL